MNFIRRYMWWVIIGAALYFLLSFHFIIIGGSVKPLKKSKLTLNYTFFNTKGKRTDTILAVDILRKAGIGELLLKKGRTNRAELKRIMAKYEDEDY